MSKEELIEDMKKKLLEIPTDSVLPDDFDWKKYTREGGMFPSPLSWVMWFFDYYLGKTTYKKNG